MNENWLTALFNEYLSGPANAVLGLFSLKAHDPAHFERVLRERVASPWHFEP